MPCSTSEKDKRQFYHANGTTGHQSLGVGCSRAILIDRLPGLVMSADRIARQYQWLSIAGNGTNNGDIRSIAGPVNLLAGIRRQVRILLESAAPVQG